MFSSGNTDTRRVGDTSAQTGVSRSTRGEDGCERSRATVHWKWARAVAGLGERESYSKTNILVLGSWAHPTGGLALLSTQNHLQEVLLTRGPGPCYFRPPPDHLS